MEIPLEIRIALFLKEFKEIVTTGRGLVIVDRRKNIRSMLQFGFTRNHCRDEILGLSVENYHSGPKPDIDRPGNVWEFGKKIERGGDIH